MEGRLYNGLKCSTLPGQQPADQLLLLLTVARPVPLNIFVEVIPQQVAAVFQIHLSHLEQQ